MTLIEQNNFEGARFIVAQVFLESDNTFYTPYMLLGYFIRVFPQPFWMNWKAYDDPYIIVKDLEEYTSKKVKDLGINPEDVLLILGKLDDKSFEGEKEFIQKLKKFLKRGISVLIVSKDGYKSLEQDYSEKVYRVPLSLKELIGPMDVNIPESEWAKSVDSLKEIVKNL